jgi:hypothetical protein
MQISRTILGFLAALLANVLTIPIILCILVFGAIASLTKLLAHLLEPRSVLWSEVIEFHPTIGWKQKPNLDVWTMAHDVFHVTTDSDGWRGNTTTLTDSDLLVFGDSHAFGHGMNDRNHFASQSRGVRVKVVGADGYNTVQQVLLMRELVNYLHGKCVVWFIFLGNDLLDNLEPSMEHYRIPFVREHAEARGWEIVTSHIDPAPWPIVARRYRETNYDRLTKLFTPTFVSNRAFSALEYLIGEGASVCKKAGARLIVMTIPDLKTLDKKGLDLLYAHGADVDSFDPDLPDRTIRAICHRLNLPFVAGTDHFGAEHYKKYGDHWNRLGHNQMANLLINLYERQGAQDEGNPLAGLPSRIPAQVI